MADTHLVVPVTFTVRAEAITAAYHLRTILTLPAVPTMARVVVTGAVVGASLVLIARRVRKGGYFTIGTGPIGWAYTVSAWVCRLHRGGIGPAETSVDTPGTTVQGVHEITSVPVVTLLADTLAFDTITVYAHLARLHIARGTFPHVITDAGAEQFAILGLPTVAVDARRIAHTLGAAFAGPLVGAYAGAVGTVAMFTERIALNDFTEFTFEAFRTHTGLFGTELVLAFTG